MPKEQEILSAMDIPEDVVGMNGRVSMMAHGLIGSEILKIATDIRAMVAEGKQICNLTVGDFSSGQFRIPNILEEGIKQALSQGETNYPPSDGVLALRTSVINFYKRWLNLHYPVESVLIAGGSRPAIYATYRAVVDPGDKVIYPVPSWNNNHYCHLVGAKGVPVICKSDNAFLPTGKQLEKVIGGARMLALNSPLNPTGTAFDEKSLMEICDVVLKENRKRINGERPLYIMYDQVYWMLTFGTTKHVNPLSLSPELAPYTIFVDGISKPFAATGVRVGWTVGPKDIIARMASILGHVGAWAPRAEQVAVAQLLNATEEIISYHATMKKGIQDRLDMIYAMIEQFHTEGFPVESMSPMGAIYLSVRFALMGKKTASGTSLTTNEEIRNYLLHEAGLAIVPFQAFGTKEEDGWFRLSVGAVSLDDLQRLAPRLREALKKLSD
jgi:aspartate aminotransferase